MLHGGGYAGRVNCIAHLDMDAFFASVELLRHPQLRDEAVVIGGRRGIAAGEGGVVRLRDYAGRGVVTTATYRAREFGVRSGLGLMQAARLCPDAILLPADFDEYRRYSRLFKSVIAEHAEHIENRGIDEVYFDLGAAAESAGMAPRAMAGRIQQAIRERTGLTCSIGIAPNKLLAKLASELDKPNGISLLEPADVEARVWPLACRKLNGIGPRSAQRLTQLGIETLGDLARHDRQALQQHFGQSLGGWLHDAAWGRDDRALVTRSEPVSMSRETTFERDLHAVRDRNELGRIFTALCTQLAADLQRKGYCGRNVAIKLRYDDFSMVTRATTLPGYIDGATAIRRAAGLCLRRAPLGRRLRLLGVRVGTLRRGLPPVAEPGSLELF